MTPTPRRLQRLPLREGGKPVTGDLIWSVPTLATLNPVGAPIAHVGLHVAAVAHNYDTELFLPPH